MRDDNFVTIQGWMVNRLGLRGDELMTYALVYGFSQDGCGWYTGGRPYLKSWLGCGEKKAGRLLNGLVEKGLLVKREAVAAHQGTCFCYQAKGVDLEPLPEKVGQNDTLFGEKGGQNGLLKGAKMAHINVIGKDKEKKNKERGGSFAPPTPAQVREKADELGYDCFPADRFVAYYESNGWMVGRSKMKSWEAAMRTWWYRDPKPTNTSRPTKPRKDLPVEEMRRRYEPERVGLMSVIDDGSVAVDSLKPYEMWLYERGWEHGIPMP